MLRDPELYSRETSSVPIQALAGLRLARRRLDKAVCEADAVLAGFPPGANPLMRPAGLEQAPAETLDALRQIYALSAANRLEFGDVRGATKDFERCFALGAPSIDELERYLGAAIDAERGAEAIAWSLDAFVDAPPLEFIATCYRIRHCIKTSRMADAKAAFAALPDPAGMAREIEPLERSTPAAAYASLALAADTLTTVQHAVVRGRALLAGCDEIVAKWDELVQRRSDPERALRILERIAGGRPIAITTMVGRGWLFSHMVAQIENFMRGLDTQGVENPFVVVLNPSRFANDALAEMYRRSIMLIDERHPRLRRALYGLYEHLKSTGSSIAQPIDRFNSIPHVRDAWTFPERIEEMVHGRSVIAFTAEDHSEGRALLERMGVPDGAAFACFGVREDSYYERVWAKKSASAFPWTCALSNGHDAGGNQEALHQQFTNLQSAMSVDISNYKKALLQCAEAGIHMLRLGTEVARPLPDGMGERIVDYARHHRTERGDLYLMTHCKFVVAGATGIYTLSMALKRPIVVTDYYLPSLGFPSTAVGVDNIILPRLFWYVPEKRLLTFGEMLQCDRRYQRHEHCLEDQIEVVHSRPEDIADAVAEMIARIDGTWVASDEDETLQRKYRALYEPYHEGRGLNARISARFLKQHERLIR